MHELFVENLGILVFLREILTRSRSGPEECNCLGENARFYEKRVLTFCGLEDRMQINTKWPTHKILQGTFCFFSRLDNIQRSHTKYLPESIVQNFRNKFSIWATKFAKLFQILNPQNIHHIQSIEIWFETKYWYLKKLLKSRQCIEIWKIGYWDKVLKSEKKLLKFIQSIEFWKNY